MAQPSLDNLGRRERQIVEAVYRLGQATVNDVMMQLRDPPSYSAVRAMLGKLEQKGYLKHVQDGPRYVYEPAVSTARARRTALRHMVNTFFEGSAEQAVLALIQLADTEISDEARQRLAAQIREAQREGR